MMTCEKRLYLAAVVLVVGAIAVACAIADRKGGK